MRVSILSCIITSKTSSTVAFPLFFEPFYSVEFCVSLSFLFFFAYQVELLFYFFYLCFFFYQFKNKFQNICVALEQNILWLNGNKEYFLLVHAHNETKLLVHCCSNNHISAASHYNLWTICIAQNRKKVSQCDLTFDSMSSLRFLSSSIRPIGFPFAIHVDRLQYFRFSFDLHEKFKANNREPIGSIRVETHSNQIIWKFSVQHMLKICKKKKEEQPICRFHITNWPEI